LSDREDILRKVQALLTKADSTGFEAEADAFREKADDLMRRFAITSYEVDIARGQANRRESPEILNMFVCQSDSPIKFSLIDLAFSCAKHARCRAVVSGSRYNSPLAKVELMVVGFPTDLRYVEMLYISLWAQLSRNLEPKPSPELTFEENVIMLLNSGQTRGRVAELMELEGTPQLYSKMSRVYKKYLHEQGREVKQAGNRAAPGTYMKNFARGFATRVENRLYEIRQRQEKEDPSGTSIVLRNRGSEVDAEFAKQFPRTGMLRTGRSKFDQGAYERGSEAGSKADLGAGRHVTSGDKKALGH